MRILQYKSLNSGNDKMKVIDKLKEVAGFLKDCGIEPAEKEAEILLKHGLGIDTVEMYRDNTELREEQTVAIGEMVSRRTMREPLQYVLGYEEFLGLRIMLGQGVLIPRPETEFMAEQAIKTVNRYTLTVIRKNKEKDRFTIHDSRFTVLDLCTGSGCLALALAKEFPEAQVYGIDISEVAVGYAEKNAKINGIENAAFLTGNLFTPLNSEAPGQLFDFIISNPPYIRTDDIKSLQPEIREWEPLNAINGGPDGLDFYRKIIPAARRFLKKSGILMLELGAGCVNEVTDMMEYSGYTQIEVINDYAAIERIIQARWKKL